VTARKRNALADRLAELSITTEELAAAIQLPVEEVEAWVAGDAPLDADAKVRLRFLANDDDAIRRAAAVRGARKLNLQGSDAVTYAGIEGVTVPPFVGAVPPYGTGDTGKIDGRRTR
jgi:hypothetical protein